MINNFDRYQQVLVMSDSLTDIGQMYVSKSPCIFCIYHITFLNVCSFKVNEWQLD